LGSSTASYNYTYKRSCTPEAIELLDRAAREGVKVQWDVYPYNYSQLNRLRSWLSPELARMGKKTGMSKLADAEFRNWLRGEMVGPAEGWYVGKLDWILACHVASCTTKPELFGRRLWDLAVEAGRTKDPLDFLCDLVLETDDQALCTIMNIEEHDLQAILRHPLAGPSSDGYALDHPLAPPRVAHPRHAGSFVRFLGRYWREQKLLPLEEAVRKMTSLPAQSVGLTDRGTLMVGNWADIVIFEADTVADRATFEDPYQRPVGIHYVLVNGVVTVENGEPTGALAGRALRRGRA
jgi:N-acyl-D-amino-acid deacylase